VRACAEVSPKGVPDTVAMVAVYSQVTIAAKPVDFPAASEATDAAKNARMTVAFILD